MGALLGAIATGIAELYSRFWVMFARKGLVATASTGAFIGTVVALIICFRSFIAGIMTLVVMPSWLVTPLGMLMPGNFVQVLSYICSAKICKFVYEVMKEKISLMNSAN